MTRLLVISVVDFAGELGLRVAAQRTGHNASPLRSLEDTVLVRTDAMQGVEIDVDPENVFQANHPITPAG